MAVFSFNSAEAQTAIVGQNNPSVDIQAVQKAVDQGGTVNLKGTFDFGNEGRVNITKDVKIVGEKDSKGTSVTKIKGGFWTFHSPLPTKLLPDVPAPRSRSSPSILMEPYGLPFNWLTAVVQLYPTTK